MNNKGVVEERFREWTNGLDAKSARISVFKHIRDIPYAIIAEFRDPVTGPAGMLEASNGSCVPKHFLLADMFNRLGVRTNYASYLFSWDDPRVAYPEELRSLTKRMPVTAHLACKALIGGNWSLVDATWDPPLKKVGFPVNDIWDGISDMENAVIPIKEVMHNSLDDRVEFAAAHRKSYSESESAAYDEFVSKVNRWLQMLRKSK